VRKTAAILLLLLVTAAIYLPSLSVPFYYDDYPHFVENPRILHPSSLSDIFRNGKQETRPVFNLSLAAQAAVFGTNRAAAHAVNVLLFFVSGLLLYLLIGRITGNPALSLLAALVFLAHPMAVESVVYVNSRSGLLALLFSLAGWLFLTNPGQRSFWSGILCLAAAIASKEDAVAAVPFAYLLRMKLGIGGGGWRRRIAIALPLLLIPTIYGFFRSPHVATVGEAVQPWYSYLWHQGIYLPLHLFRFVWPAPLTFNWDLPPAWFSAPVVLGGWVLVVTAAALAWRRRDSLEAFGLAWMVLALIPTHSVVPLLDVAATRISYPALPGFALLLSAPLAGVFRRFSRPAFVTGVLLLLFFSWRTVTEIWVWRNPVRMWEGNVEAAPSRWRGWVNLAVEYGERKQWAEAWSALSNAARLSPDEPEILLNQAVVAGTRTDGLADVRYARTNLIRVLWLDPKQEKARALLRQLEGRFGKPGRN
jgi:protein O-mannosyl-transferase